MATEVKLPRLGQGMESGTIVRWLRGEGDEVKKNDPLFELDTDKVTQEVEAEADGVLLKILIHEGDVAVGTTVAVIGVAGEDVNAASAAAAPEEPAEAASTNGASAEIASTEIASTEVASAPVAAVCIDGRRVGTAGDRSGQGEPAGAPDRAREGRRSRSAHRHRPRWAHHRAGCRRRCGRYPGSREHRHRDQCPVDSGAAPRVRRRRGHHPDADAQDDRDPVVGCLEGAGLPARSPRRHDRGACAARGARRADTRRAARSPRSTTFSSSSPPLP